MSGQQEWRQHKKRKRLWSRIILNDNMRTMTRDKTRPTWRSGTEAGTLTAARDTTWDRGQIWWTGGRQAGLLQHETPHETLVRQDTDAQAHVTVRQRETPHETADRLDEQADRQAQARAHETADGRRRRLIRNQNRLPVTHNIARTHLHPFEPFESFSAGQMDSSWALWMCFLSIWKI